jgi:hypothetical protein
MNGSEKQIKWAEDIKRNMLEELAAVEAFAKSESGKAFMVRSYGEVEPVEREIGDTLAAIEKTRSFINSQKEAKFFIDNRNRLAIALAKADKEVYQIVRSEMEMAKRARAYSA